MEYRCGGCGHTVTLTAGDAVRCNTCGSRILWKKRTKKTVEYDARREEKCRKPSYE